MLIWDTGEYSILPWRDSGRETDDGLSSASNVEIHSPASQTPENQKLHLAFQSVRR